MDGEPNVDVGGKLAKSRELGLVILLAYVVSVNRRDILKVYRKS